MMMMTRSTNKDSGQGQRQMTTTDNNDGQQRGEPSKRRMMDNEEGLTVLHLRKEDKRRGEGWIIF